MTGTDRIEKRLVLRATRARVWRALTDAKEFGTWFGMALEGPFIEGATIQGWLTIPGYEHLSLEMRIERIQPETYFAHRWHPNAIDPNMDYSTEPMTLVEYRLAEAQGGTELTIIESGWDGIPESRRAEAFRSNSGGWTGVLQQIERHVAT